MVSRLLLVAAAIYFLTGIALGMYMGITHDVRLSHVHVHVNLLGWVSLALIALIYRALPRLQRGWVPPVHFWLHNIGLLLFMGGVARIQLTGDRFIPPIVVGSSMLTLGIVLWVAHLIIGIRREG
jgi:cbb3-type cytochrome oxidase subunit 1